MVDPVIGYGLEGVKPGGMKGPGGAGGVGAGAPDGAASFKDLLENSIQRVNEMQQAVDKAQSDVVTGGVQNFSEVNASVKKAELAFQELVEIRNKLVDAYQEIMRMQV